MAATTPFDSVLFRNTFGTAEARECFSEHSYVSYLIKAECALAQAEADELVIPQEAAAAIKQHSDVCKVDWEQLAAQTEIVGYPVLPLVRQMTSWVPDGMHKYIHWGATTQDIMDLASILQMKRGLQIVRTHCEDLVGTVGDLVEKYKDTPMAGRTHLQQALPVTFGYKCAVWLSGLQRHLQRLDQIEERCLLVQFGGAAGTLASLGSDGTGIRVRRRLADLLGLKDSVITWHVARDSVAEIVNYLAILGGSLGKIALDLILMSSNELGEAAEPFVPDRGASSTMPQKRNPISSEIILAASKTLRSHAGLVLDGMVCDFERASGPWHLEWVAIPQAFVTAIGALSQARFALSGLTVNVDAMMDNLLSTKGLIVAEAVMMGLARHFGRDAAHDMVYEACRKANDTGQPLLTVLEQTPVVSDKMTAAELASLCDARNYLGCCSQMSDDVLRLNGNTERSEDKANVKKNGISSAQGLNGVLSQY